MTKDIYGSRVTGGLGPAADNLFDPAAREAAVERSIQHSINEENAGRRPLIPSGRLFSSICGPGYEEIDAPTTDPSRPRAHKCCYNPNAGSADNSGYLAIMMRDMSLIGYDNVTQDMWDELKSIDSTHTFINTTLGGWQWEKTSYGQLPRTRPQSFNLGTQE
jgi:hypothetical protein